MTLRVQFARDGNDALFITAEGKRMTCESVKAMQRLAHRVGIPRLYPHLVRHAAVMNGANQFELKRILGHTQLSTTDEYMDYAQQHLVERHWQFSPMAKVSERQVSITAKRENRRRK